MHVTIPEASRITGIPRSTLLRWIETGYLTPVVRSLGKGDSTQLDERNLKQCRALAAIVAAFGDGSLTRRVIEETLPGVKPTTRAIAFSTEIPLE